MEKKMIGVLGAIGFVVVLCCDGGVYLCFTEEAGDK